jgi:hypothetical protein
MLQKLVNLYIQSARLKSGFCGVQSSFTMVEVFSSSREAGKRF